MPGRDPVSSFASSWPADWLVPDWPAPPWVRAVCTTRSGGVSGMPWGSLNLGDHVGDDPAAVQANRDRLAACLQAAPVFLQQVHGTAVACLERAQVVPPPPTRKADACVTREPGIACTVMVADCLPVLLVNTQDCAVAAAHAGWRGLAGAGGHGVLESVLGRLCMLGADAAETTMAWLGPCIGPQVFEVGDDVRQAFMSTHTAAGEMFVPTGQAGKWWCNLPGLARLRLQTLGVGRIYGNDGSQTWCTVRNPSRFFSHRRDTAACGGSGRFAACIWVERERTDKLV